MCSRLLLAATYVLLLAAGPSPAHAGEVLSRIGTVAVPSASASTPFRDFDISFVDPDIDRYLLADVSHGSLDVFQASTGAFLFSIGGFSGNHPPGWTHNGPSGVVTVVRAGRQQAWVADGNSTVKVVDLAARRLVAAISTGGKARVDEMCYDKRDQIVLADNPDEATPFVTFISTRPGYAVLGKLTFPAATDGLEQAVWSPRTGMFYLAVPDVDGTSGGVAIIDPVGRKLLRLIRVQDCHPNGAALGSGEHLLLGCREQGVKRPGQMHPSGAVMLDMRTGEKVASFPAVVGSDQIAYNPGDDRFYVTAFGSPGGPVLAAIDAAPGAPVLFARTGDLAHSVAVDSRTNHIFVPLRPDPRDRSCHYGCVGVFAIENSR